MSDPAPTWKEEGSIIAEATMKPSNPAADDDRNAKAQEQMLAKAIAEATGPLAPPPRTKSSSSAESSRSSASSGSYYSDVDSDTDKEDCRSEQSRRRAGPVAPPPPPAPLPMPMYMPQVHAQFIPSTTPR